MAGRRRAGLNRAADGRTGGSLAVRDEYFRYLDHFGPVLTVAQYAREPGRQHAIALRHDVDHDLDFALELGWWEQRRGVTSTYYLLHTAEYWHDPELVQKCLQLADFGHEIGLHVNTLARWVDGRADDVAADLKATLERLRAAGIAVRTVSAHGDPLCYRRQFINYWAFAELRPADPAAAESGRNAEGVPAPNGRFRIDYPASQLLRRDDGAEFPFWSVSMAALGLEHEAMHVPGDGYFSDSGGSWSRSPDPLELDLSRGRHQVLMHPEHWRGPQRLYFFLSLPRSGSTWLSGRLAAATPLESRHEFLLNHRYADGALRAEKRTLTDLPQLLAAPERVRGLLLEGRNWIEDQGRDYAEANVYLHHFPQLLKELFPDAQLVQLHRDPRDVVRSLMDRDWYDTPEDARHPPVAVSGWDALDQFERVCAFVRDAGERLASLCSARLALAEAARDDAALAAALGALGIPWYPRLAAARPAAARNESTRREFPEYADWGATRQAQFEQHCGALRGRLGYGSAVAAAPVEPAAAAPAVARSELLCNIDYHAAPARSPLALLRRAAAGCFAAGTALVARFRRARVFDYRLLPPGSTRLLRVGATRCRVRATPEALQALPDPGANSNLVLGGGRWHTLPPGAGWPAGIGHWYRGSAEFAMDGEAKLSLFCLMYDAAGKMFEQRHLANFDAEFPARRFSFRTRPATARFAVALHQRAAEARPYRVLRLRLERIAP